MYSFFYAIAHLDLAQATLFNYATPLYAPFIAALWLGETVPNMARVAIAVGFVGIFLILEPTVASLSPPVFLGLASGVFAAVAMVGVRHLAHSEPAVRIVFYFSLVSTLISAVPLVPAWQTPAPGLWLVLIGIGVLASVVQMFITPAYFYAAAAAVGPFSYATIVFAAIAGWLFFGEVQDGLSLAGAALACLGGVLTIRYGGRRVLPPVDTA